MANVNYPVGIESFEKIRLQKMLYIDKTEFVQKLVSNEGYFFLSRPRRFGKSLLLTTIKAFYEGRRELFEGLAITKYDHSWEKHPVFHLNLVNFNTESTDGLKSILEQHLRYWEEDYNLQGNKELDFAQRFFAVIRRAVEMTGQKAVILVDEYDKALVSSLGDDKKELHDSFRAILKPLYGTLKAADQYICFAMITGVSRFSRLSIFSDLNNLRDISLNKEYSAICGITEEEMLRDCNIGIRKLADKRGISYNEAADELKRNYDGYHFTEDCPDIYNPFSLLSALEDVDIASYWFSTGTPTFLMNSIRNLDFYLPDFNHLKAYATDLSSAEMYMSNPIPMLFQTGYLTIDSFNPTRKTYFLRIPNLEVEEGIFNYLIPAYSGKKNLYCNRAINSFLDEVEDGRPEEFLLSLQSFLADIPYELSENKPETYYENNIYIILKIMGYTVHTEYRTSNGRIDLLVTTDRFIYVIELKLNGTAEDALRQIEEKQYALPFTNDSRKLFKIGISFSHLTRNIDNWIII